MLGPPVLSVLDAEEDGAVAPGVHAAKAELVDPLQEELGGVLECLEPGQVEPLKFPGENDENCSFDKLNLQYVQICC